MKEIQTLQIYRRIQTTIWKAVVLLSLGGLLSWGCSSSSGLKTYRYAGSRGPIDLLLDWYPELTLTGGTILLQTDRLNEPLMVTRISSSQISAVTPLCPVDSCRVTKQAELFRCNCDGSEFTLEGIVVRGPARQSLQRMRTELSGTQRVTIYFE